MVERDNRRFIVACVALVGIATFASLVTAQSKKSVRPAPNPDSGLQLYKRNCAVCHGNDLKGNGLISPEYKNPPADLTRMAQRHNGEFPDTYVYDILRNDVKTTAHGNTEMPIWGPIFKSRSGTNPPSDTLRILNLTNYIKSMQVK